jgi:hypothetical protein
VVVEGLRFKVQGSRFCRAAALRQPYIAAVGFKFQVSSSKFKVKRFRVGKG